MRPLIVGNWKMNGLTAQLADIVALSASMKAQPARADVLVCPPFTLIERAARAADGIVSIGAQNCHHAASGARTGEVSAEMLRDSGATAVIVGHSERRQQHGETDAMVAAKARAAARAGLLAIICVGETQAQPLRAKPLSHARRSSLEACHQKSPLPPARSATSRFGRLAVDAHRRTPIFVTCTRISGNGC